MTRSRLTLTLTLLTLPVCVRADTITLDQVADQLEGAAIPLASGVSDRLAVNLLEAQTDVPYASSLSLDLSIDAVLRAVGIYLFPGGPTTITTTDAPIVWLQSNVAIDPNATVTLDPPALTFLPTTVPEPSTAVLTILGACLVLGVRQWAIVRHRRRQRYLDVFYARVRS